VNSVWSMYAESARTTNRLRASCAMRGQQHPERWVLSCSSCSPMPKDVRTYGDILQQAGARLPREYTPIIQCSLEGEAEWLFGSQRVDYLLHGQCLVRMLSAYSRVLGLILMPFRHSCKLFSLSDSVDRCWFITAFSAAFAAGLRCSFKTGLLDFCWWFKSSSLFLITFF